MTIISLIAAVDEQGGLGRHNQLLCHLPADLEHFKAITLGKPVIMGRKTHESIGKVLPGRLNIVLSQQFKTLRDVTVLSSLTDAILFTKNEPEIMIIGGATLFEQAISMAHRVYLTLIHAAFEADVFFPKLDNRIWACKDTIERPHDEKNQQDITFLRYERDLDHCANKHGTHLGELKLVD